MVTLSAFADEISANLETQLDTLEQERIRHIEFRGVWDKNVVRLTDEELNRVQAELARRNFQVSAIGSPIGKIGIDDDFEAHVRDFERIVRIAKRFDTPFVRVFSFFIPDGEDPARHRDTVMSRLETLLRIAERNNIVLLHENEKHIYGDTTERCLDIMETFQSEHFRMAFDPANFVQCGVKPFVDAYPRLAPYVTYVHIKDAYLQDGKVVPAGKGDGDVVALLEALHAKGYAGYLSIEPHLASAGTFSGFSGPALFQVAAQALKGILDTLKISWQ